MGFKLTRRRFLAAGLATFAGVGYGWGIEPHWLRLCRVRVPLRRPPRTPLRILQLSDFHHSSFVGMEYIEHAIDLGLDQRPDVVCLTGDYVTAGDAKPFTRYREALARLAGRAPTFAVLGNHDGGPWAEARGGLVDPSRIARVMRDSGITLLRNAWQATVGDLAIAGTTDLSSGAVGFHAAFEGLDPDAASAVILLAHNPDSKDFVGHRPWDLMLSGHTHGGQVVVPFLGPPYVPIDDRRFTAGLHPWRDRHIYTTRGVGNLFGVRINCRPEVALIELG